MKTISSINIFQGGLHTYSDIISMMRSSIGYKSIPITFNRRAVIASATITKELRNTIHCITEVDITERRKLIKEHFTKTGEKLSLTAYVITCLAHVIKDHPLLNSFIKGNRQIILDDVTVSVLVEREVNSEKVPEPLGISQAQEKSYLQINKEIRDAQKTTGGKLGSLSGMTWIRFIPDFLLRTFMINRNQKAAIKKHYKPNIKEYNIP